MTSTNGKTPWHIWFVGILALLWNAAGAVTIVLAQMGRLPDISAEEAAYYAAQPLWFVVLTDIALFSAIGAAVALLLRSRVAVTLFTVSLVAIVVTNLYDLSVASSRALFSTGAAVATTVIVVLAILELLYAKAMSKRSLLR
jgi:hypothetical protein